MKTLTIRFTRQTLFSVVSILNDAGFYDFKIINFALTTIDEVSLQEALQMFGDLGPIRELRKTFLVQNVVV